MSASELSSHLEREDKFDVDPDFVRPDLTDLSGAEPRIADVRVEEQELRSEYFDTADRDLLHARLTLRRRTGSVDQGWQLKVPQKPAREEIRFDEPTDEVPDELARLLFGVRRDQPLHPVAELNVHRTVVELLDADGATLAEVADDTVSASAAGDAARASTWREVEVEAGPAGDEPLLAAVGHVLQQAGARPSTSPSKLTRALGEAAPEPDDPIRAYLIEQQQAILAGDLMLRRGDDSVIHKTRVALRRFRSTLRVFGRPGLLGAAEAELMHLDGELRWFAGVLGEVRDRQVMRSRLLALVDELDDTEVLGPVRTRIEVELDRERAAAWVEVGRVMTSDRYLQLLGRVNDFVLALPPRTKPKPVRKAMRQAEKKVAKRLRGIDDDPVRVHRARKAAKRARYAGELAAPAAGAEAAEQAARNQARQDELGEHQDSVVTAELLLRLGGIAGTTPGENGFTFGLLYERERQRAAAIRAGLAT